jgi:hypothetical protein
MKAAAWKKSTNLGAAGKIEGRKNKAPSLMYHG